MELIKVSDNFYIQEYVSPQVLEAIGYNALSAIDDRLLRFNEFFRKYFGATTINNWHTGGNYKSSGLRTIQDNEYKMGSQHSFGRASDNKVNGVGTENIINTIIKNKEVFMKEGLTGIEALELTPTWCHVTVGYYPEAKGRLAIIYENRIDYV